MPIRLLATDLDGTLLNSQSEISPSNQQALIAAARRGVKLVVVTGRRLQAARRFVEQIPCPVTLIASNGALISSGAEILYRNFLPRQTAQRVLATTRPFRPYGAALFDVPGRGQILMQNNATPTGPLGWYLAQSREYLKQVDDLEAAITVDPVELLFGGAPTSIEAIEVLLRASAVANEIQPTWTKYGARNLWILDIMNRGCTKGAALAYWADRCGINPSEVMAIGDNFNDLEMLEFAGLPILMANRSPGLGPAEWPVTLSNDQDGVARAIETYVLR